MTDTTTRDGPARFAELDKLATQLFGTSQWRTLLRDRYGISSAATVTAWAHKGPPSWVVPAVRDAILADAVRGAMRAID